MHSSEYWRVVWFWGSCSVAKPRLALLSNLNRNTLMIQTIAILLLILWLLGVVSSYTLSGFIHILLVVAVVLVLVRIIQGRSPV